MSSISECDPETDNQCSLFDDPDQEERTLYAKYWQKKLESNEDISFPDELVTDVAASTDQFSFAYLKEALYVAASHRSCFPQSVTVYRRW